MKGSLHGRGNATGVTGRWHRTRMDQARMRLTFYIDAPLHTLLLDDSSFGLGVYVSGMGGWLKTAAERYKGPLTKEHV